MKRVLSVRSLLILVGVGVGILFLSACGSRRASRPYVYVPPSAAETRAAQTSSVETQRAPRSTASRDRQDQIQSRRAEAASPAPRPREDARPESTRRDTSARVVVVDPVDELSDESAGTFSFLRRSNREEADTTRSGLNAPLPTHNRSAPSVANASFDEPISAPVAQGYRLRPADQIAVSLRGIPESADYEFIIPDDGYINLPFITEVQAVGLTISELQRLIHDRYVEEQIYRQLSVNVLLPTQYYFVRGEVRQSGRFPLTSGTTVLQAIAAAGGYTEFANPRRVEIIRSGETITGNARQMEQNPEEDFRVKAGDVIIVRRSIF